jgi:hypothetical protein
MPCLALLLLPLPYRIYIHTNQYLSYKVPTTTHPQSTIIITMQLYCTISAAQNQSPHCSPYLSHAQPQGPKTVLGNFQTTSKLSSSPLSSGSARPLFARFIRLLISLFSSSSAFWVFEISKSAALSSASLATHSLYMGFVSKVTVPALAACKRRFWPASPARPRTPAINWTARMLGVGCQLFSFKRGNCRKMREGRLTSHHWQGLGR